MRTRLYLMVLASAFLLSACDVKVKSDPPAAPAPKPVVGPDISGHWVSECTQTLAGPKIFDVTFKDQSVVRRNILFNDADCNYVQKDTVEAGTFRYVEALADGSYTVEYRIPISNGWHALPKENVLLESDSLYISDYTVGVVQKNLMIPLKRKQQ